MPYLPKTELARKNATGPLCPAAFSSNLTVLLKNGSDFFFSPEEKKDTETGCAENCRRRACRLTCLRHSALSAARAHLSRKSVARIAERRTCARRRQTAGTVNRRIGTVALVFVAFPRYAALLPDILPLPLPV